MTLSFSDDQNTSCVPCFERSHSSPVRDVRHVIAATGNLPPEQCARTAPKQTWGRRPSGGISMPYFGGLHELQVKWIIMWLSSRIFIQKKMPLRLTCVGISLVSISHLGTNPVQHVWLALGRATRPKVIGGWVPLNEII